MEASSLRINYIFLIFVVLAIVFAPFTRGFFYGTGDMRDVFIPLELFFQQQQRAGSIPSWNPDMSWGFPVIAAAQIGFFYPPLLLARYAPISFYLPAIFFAHFFALGAGLFIFLRRHTALELSAFLGALSFTVGLFVIQHITHLNIILAIAWLPWQLLVAEYLALNQRPLLKYSLLFSLLTGLPFLIGQLQIPFLCAALASIYALYRYISLHRAVKNIVLSLCLVVIIVTGISAAQILPTMELIVFSSRNAPDGVDGNFDLLRANQHSFAVQQLITFVFPRFFGSDSTYWGKRLEVEYGVFMGTLPLLIAFSSIRRFSFKNSFYRFWFTVTIISFLLCLGRWSPFRLIGFEPSLWFFSAPARWLLYSTLGLSILSAFGWDYLLQSTAYFKKILTISFISLLSAVLIYNFLIFVLKPEATHILTFAKYLVPLQNDSSYYLDKINILLSSTQTSGLSLKSIYTYIPLGILAAALFLIKNPKILTIFALLTVMELGFVAGTSSPLVSWNTLLSVPETYKLLPQKIKDRQERLLSLRDGGDIGAIFTDPRSKPNTEKRAQQKNLLLPLMHSQFGTAGVEWAASLDLIKQYEIRNRMSLRDLNIGALLVPNDLTQPDNVKLVQQYQNINIYSVDSLPRASVIDADGTINPSATAHYESLTPTTTRITVSTDKPARVLVRDTWYPDWKAYQNELILSVDEYPPFFQVFTVPAGNSVTELRYEPRMIKYGLLITLSTLILVSAVLIGLLILKFRYENRSISS